MTVEHITAAVTAMREARELPQALLGGTKAMRAASEKFLPREPAESIKAYGVRLARSFLFPGYSKAVSDMAGKIFARPIIVQDDVPPQIKAAMENVDLAGRNLDVFGHEVAKDGIHAGISYILVEMDPAPVDGEGRPLAISRAQAREMQRRPWAVHIKASQVLGWRSQTVGGVERLTQFRFAEVVTEDNGEFGETQIEQVRVFSREGDAVTWSIWRNGGKGAQGGWFKHDEGPVTIGEIAVCPVYMNRTGFMQALPPLANLAEVNLAHWQSQSDQRNILHVARVPILFGAGFTDADDDLEIGASRMTLGPEGATLQYVEHSGAAIDAGRQDIKDLEDQMQMLGLELLVPRPAAETATGASIDQAKMNTPLAMMAKALQDALEQMLGFMAMYEGLPRDSGGGSLVVNTDFGVSLGSAADGTTLTEAVKERIISRATWIREMKRRAVLSEDVDPEEEAQAALDEGMDDEDEVDTSAAFPGQRQESQGRTGADAP